MVNLVRRCTAPSGPQTAVRWRTEVHSEGVRLCWPTTLTVQEKRGSLALCTSSYFARRTGHRMGITLHLNSPTSRAVKPGRIDFASWELMGRGNRCWISTMQVLENSPPTGIGSPSMMKAADNSMSLLFLVAVPELQFLRLGEMIPDGDETGRSFSTLRMI